MNNILTAELQSPYWTIYLKRGIISIVEFDTAKEMDEYMTDRSVYFGENGENDGLIKASLTYDERQSNIVAGYEE